MTIATLLIYGVMAIAAGVFLAVVIKVLKSVKGKAIASGVVFSDGLNSRELKLVARLLKEEAEKVADEQAFDNLKKVIASFESKKGV